MLFTFQLNMDAGSGNCADIIFQILNWSQCKTAAILDDSEGSTCRFSISAIKPKIQIVAILFLSVCKCDLFYLDCSTEFICLLIKHHCFVSRCSTRSTCIRNYIHALYTLCSFGSFFHNLQSFCTQVLVFVQENNIL